MMLPAGSLLPAPAPIRLIVVVSSSQKVSDLSSGDLRRIYIGEMTRWPNGHRIVPVMPPRRSGESGAFLKHVVRMSAIDFAQEWISVVFRGRAPAPPVVVATASEALDIVASHQDAIAVIPDIEIRAGLRVITIDGRAPRASDYPLNW